MSKTLERQLAELTEQTGYEVRFEHAGTFHDWFSVYVFYDGKLVARKCVLKSYPRAARWARRQVKRHQRGHRILGSLLAPKEDS